MSSGLVSIVVTTYYRNDWLRSALASVRKQTYEPLEVIVVDGSGTEHAQPVIHGQREITYLPQKEDVDVGPQAGRSLGAKHSSGEYVQFLDDDDRLHPAKIQKQVRLLRRRPDAGVAYCGYRNERGQAVFPHAEKRGDVLEFALTNQLAPCVTSTMLIERDTLEDFLPLENRHGADDVGTKIELALRTEFEFVDEILVTRGDPPYHLGSSWAAVDGLYRVLDRYDHLYRDRPEIEGTLRSQIKMKEALVTLQERPWSVAAVEASLASIKHHPSPSTKEICERLLVLGGRPGYEMGRTSMRFVNRFRRAL